METRIMNRVKELMAERGMSVTEVANKIEARPFLVQSYLDNRYNPRLYFIIRLALLFEVSTDYLLGLSDEREIKK